MKKAIYDKNTRRLVYIEMEECEIAVQEPTIPEITQDEINCDLDYRISCLELGL